MRSLRKIAILAAGAVSLAGCGQVQDFDQSSTATTSHSQVDIDDSSGTSVPDETDAGENEAEDTEADTGTTSTTAPRSDEPEDESAADADSDADPDENADDEPVEETGVPATLSVEVLNTYPHDGSAFTQGLVIVDGVLFESTGLYGESSRRRVARTSGEVSSTVALDESLFGAGLAAVDDTTLIQLTWREGVAILSDTVTLEEFDRFNYSGEGWGLCHDGERLVMSDGSATLTVRDPMSFSQLDSIEVTRDGEPIPRLNELECVDGDVWANVWLTNEIVRINGTTGEVTGIADLSALVPEGPLGEEEVLNGIAYDPATNLFYVTGKNWDVLYEVRFTDS